MLNFDQCRISKCTVLSRVNETKVLIRSFFHLFIEVNALTNSSNNDV
jgi:hypothetical protein